MPRKKVSNQNDDVNRDDKNNTDYKEELKLHDRPEENQHRHDANQGQVKRVAFEVPIEYKQVICRLNECIVGIGHEPSPLYGHAPRRQ